MLGANPEHQGLSLPWSEDDESSLEPPSKPDSNNEPHDWLASPDPAAAQLQFGKLPSLYYLVKISVCDAIYD